MVEIIYPAAGEGKSVLSAGLDDFTKDNETEKYNSSDRQSVSLIELQEKFSVGLERCVNLPKDTEILDEHVRVRDQINEIVRLELYDHECSAAFSIDQEGTLMERSALRLGYRLSIQRVNKTT